MYSSLRDANFRNKTVAMLIGCYAYGALFTNDAQVGMQADLTCRLRWNSNADVTVQVGIGNQEQGLLQQRVRTVQHHEILVSQTWLSTTVCLQDPQNP